MKKLIGLFLGSIAYLFVFQVQPVIAQCAMCASTVESSIQGGDNTAKGLNDGIMYLLAAPYLAVAALGFLWYKKYRRKDVKLEMKQEKFNMN